jgi:hypothetical protein
MRTRSIALSLIAAAGSLHAQSAREPKPDGRRLRLGTDSLEVFVVRQGRPVRTGAIVDRLDTVRVDGDLLLRRVYRRTDAALGNGVDTLVDRFPDLAPRSVRSTSDGGGTETLTWRAGRLTGAVERSGTSTRAIDTTVAASAFSRSSVDLVLRASPLAVGYEVAVPAYSARQGAATITARVAASETLPGFGTAWRVEADYGGMPVTSWIDAKARRVVRQVIRVAPGTELLYVATRRSGDGR